MSAMHQRHPNKTFDLAAIHDQHERAGRQAPHQRPCVRHEEVLVRDLRVLKEAGQTLDAALALAAVGRFAGDGGQVRPPAAHDAAD